MGENIIRSLNVLARSVVSIDLIEMYKKLKVHFKFKL